MVLKCEHVVQHVKRGFNGELWARACGVTLWSVQITRVKGQELHSKWANRHDWFCLKLQGHCKSKKIIIKYCRNRCRNWTKNCFFKIWMNRLSTLYFVLVTFYSIDFNCKVLSSHWENRQLCSFILCLCCNCILFVRVCNFECACRISFVIKRKNWNDRTIQTSTHSARKTAMVHLRTADEHKH